TNRGGRPEDFENFPKFMANLKHALESTGGRDELSITLPASYWYLQHFDLKKLSPHVDYFNIMSYDLHGTWDQGKWKRPYGLTVCLQQSPLRGLDLILTFCLPQRK